MYGQAPHTVADWPAHWLEKALVCLWAERAAESDREKRREAEAKRTKQK